MNNFVVIVFGVFQLVLLFHFSISVCTITTLKSHTEKNDECCFIEWSGISFDNILGRCNVVLKSGVVETVVAPSLYPSCLYAHHWISIQKQQNSARLRFMENTHQGALPFGRFTNTTATQLQMNSLKDSFVCLFSYLVSYFFACSLKLTGSWQLLTLTY